MNTRDRAFGGIVVCATLALCGPVAAVDYPIVIHRGNGLANLFARLNSGQTAKIAYIGGSITQNPGWRDNVTAWFNSRYPGRITEINAGWSGTGSLIGAMRLARDVLAQGPHLIFVEFAVNDLPEDPLVFVERNSEGIIRQAWASSGTTDLCFIETIAYYSEGAYLAGHYPTPVQAHYNVCDLYGCPSVNVGWALYEHVLAGTSWESLTINGDKVHPNAAGSQIYSDAVIGYLESERTRGGSSATHNVPAALTDFPVTGSTIKDWVTVSPLPAGWSARYNEYGVAGFVQSSTPGSTISIGFTGPEAAVKVIVGPDSAGWNGLEYSVDGGAYLPANISVNGWTYLWAFPVSKMASTGTHTLTMRVNSGVARLINVEAATSGGSGPGPDAVNHALTAVATQADTYYGDGFEPEKARDGLLTTKWCTTNATPAHWLAYDLGRTVSVEQFVVKHAGAGGEYASMNTEAFTIESASSLSGPWTVEFTGSNPGQANTSTFAYASAKPLRYVRLNISDPGVDNYARIYEFEVWGPPVTGPTITQHPTARTICPGGATTFSVVASGQGTLTYQWQKNQANLANGGHYAGVTTATLTVAGVNGEDVASYRCVVTDGIGSTSSNEAALTLKAATTIVQSPAARTVPAGGTATFTVVATGDGVLTYQWQKNQTNLANGGHYAGVTTATLTVAGVDSADVASYRCVVAGGCGSATSNAATLTLQAAIADFDGDGDVDLEDFSRFQTCFNGPNRAPAFACSVDADLDNDADVDLTDFSLFQLCFAGPNRTPAATCP